MRFGGDPRDEATVERLEDLSGEHGIWECTRCFFCNERCPKGVDPRDAIAKLGAEAISHGIDRDMGAKHAKWFIRSTETTGWLRETELVPKTQGVVSSVKQMKFAMNLARHSKAGLEFPPHVAKDVKEARDLRKITKAQDRQGALGHVQGERALSKLKHGYDPSRDPYAPGPVPPPHPPREGEGGTTAPTPTAPHPTPPSRPAPRRCARARAGRRTGAGGRAEGGRGRS